MAVGFPAPLWDGVLRDRCPCMADAGKVSAQGGSDESGTQACQTNGVRLHYVTAGSGPIVLCLHGWPETHREYLVVMERLGHKYRFIEPDLRGFADSDKPFSGYEPKTIAAECWGCSRRGG